MRQLPLLIALLGLLGAFCCSAGDVYHWVDPQGQAHFSQHPPPDTAPGEKQPGASSAEATPETIGLPPSPGPMLVSGKVVDRHARVALPGVKVSVKRTGFVPEQNRSFVLGTPDQVVLSGPDGAFEVGCDRCLGLLLEFSKDGYHPSQQAIPSIRVQIDRIEDAPQFFVRETMPEGRVRMLEKHLSGGSLEKMGDRIWMKDYGGRISSGPNRDDYVLVVDRDRGGSRSLSALRSDIASGEPPPFVALDPQTSRAIMEGFYALPEAEQRQSVDVNDTVYLDFSNAKGGVQPYHPDRMSHNVLRDMKKAPESGYRSRLAIERNPSGRNYFYCRIDGKYCRGSVSRPYIMPGRKPSRGSATLTLSRSADGERVTHTYPGPERGPSPGAVEVHVTIEVNEAGGRGLGIRH